MNAAMAAFSPIVPARSGKSDHAIQAIRRLSGSGFGGGGGGSSSGMSPPVKPGRRSSRSFEDFAVDGTIGEGVSGAPNSRRPVAGGVVKRSVRLSQYGNGMDEDPMVPVDI
jgi:hypothetical protein